MEEQPRQPDAVAGLVEVRVRWWAAVPLAVVVSVAGAVADLRIDGALRWLFGGALAVGCLVAVLVVSGPGLVAAMVEPPVVAVLAVGAGRSSPAARTAGRRPCWPSARG